MEPQLEPAARKLQGYIDGFLWILPNLVIAAIVLALFVSIAWAVRRSIARHFRRHGRPDLGGLLAGFAKWALILFGILVVATIVFPSVKPADLLATLGIGSVAIGFAFKDILQNWLSGLLILWRQPFRTGDQIVSGGPRPDPGRCDRARHRRRSSRRVEVPASGCRRISIPGCSQ